MLCGGITTYSPLVANGCGPGKRVGIVGVGGLGHFGILWAKALKADFVLGLSRRGNKRADALALGCNAYVATDEDENWAKKFANSLDIIISTVSSPKMPLRQYLGLLRSRGIFVQVGAPEESLPPISAFDLIPKERRIGGSAIGPPGMIKEMLELAAREGVRPWVQTRKMGEANEVVKAMERGEARYRFVLGNE
jgi:alcohol dehydrogenase (NADP+)